MICISTLKCTVFYPIWSKNPINCNIPNCFLFHSFSGRRDILKASLRNSCNSILKQSLNFIDLLNEQKINSDSFWCSHSLPMFIAFLIYIHLWWYQFSDLMIWLSFLVTRWSFSWYRELLSTTGLILMMKPVYNLTILKISLRLHRETSESIKEWVLEMSPPIQV